MRACVCVRARACVCVTVSAIVRMSACVRVMRVYYVYCTVESTTDFTIAEQINQHVSFIQQLKGFVRQLTQPTESGRL